MKLNELFNSLPSDIKNKIKEKVPVNQILANKNTSFLQSRFPVILLLDSSGSMSGGRIDEINAGLQYLKAGLQAYRNGQGWVSEFIQEPAMPLIISCM